MLPIITALVVLLAAYVYNFYQNVKRLPKGPTPLPIIGNVLQINAQKPQDSFEEFAQTYGNVFTVYLPKPMVVIMDHKGIKEAFVTKGDDFVGRSGAFPDDLFQNMDNGGVLFSQGEEWKENRRISIQILRDFGMGKNLMEELVKDSFIDFNNYLQSLKNKEQGLDFRMPIQVFVANIIHQTLFGFRYPFEESDELMKFADILNNQMEHIRDSKLTFLALSYTWVKKIPFLGWYAERRHFEFVQPMKVYIQQQLEKSLEGYTVDQEPNSFAQAYMQRAGKALDEKYIQEQLRNISMDFFLAGMETTSTTLRWAMLFMAAHPDVQEKCRKEVLSVVGPDRIPSLSDKPQMPYIGATINELQRVANIVPLNVLHRTVRDTSVGGKDVPVNTLVVGQVYSVLRNREVFKKPESFYPERFLMKDGKTPNKETVDQMIAFSMGKRQCAGEALARVELFIGLSAILQRYKVSPLPGQKVDLEPNYASILLPKAQKLRVETVNAN